MRTFGFNSLSTADLIVDTVYEGGVAGNTSDDPLSRLLGCGNQGGFRKVGQPPKYVVLYSSLEDPEWPDSLDTVTGLFTYYGDNKKPGHELHDTARRGNLLLRDVFACMHEGNELGRRDVPPFFVFSKYITGSKRSVMFRGLAAPGGKGIAATDDLVALWKSSRGERFQNYRSLFTILDTAVVPREWLVDVRNGNPLSSNCPAAWRKWVKTGTYAPLQAQPSFLYRTIEEQLPKTPLEWEIVTCIYTYFQDYPVGFERCAATIAAMMDANVIIDEVTRASMDGGRDAIGRYRIGPAEDPVYVEFALEAKCYHPGAAGTSANTVGVRETSRIPHACARFNPGNDFGGRAAGVRRNSRGPPPSDHPLRPGPCTDTNSQGAQF